MCTSDCLFLWISGAAKNTWGFLYYGLFFYTHVLNTNVSTWEQADDDRYAVANSLL